MVPMILMVAIVTLLNCCSAEISTLEKFLTSGFNKETTDADQGKENADVATSNDLIKFMRRAGLITADNQITDQQRLINNLQRLNAQRQSAVYQPQQSQPTNYAAPKRQLEAPQQQQQQYLAQISNRLVSDASSKAKKAAASGSQQDGSSKAIGKADRQGLYAQDGHAYDSEYSGHHDGYVLAKDGYSEHQDSYSAGHYAPEPVYHKEAYAPPPKASVAIKIDPISILRILLQGIPRPLLNLNGKLFFGVELGKNAGIVKGVGYAPPHAGGHYPAPPPPKRDCIISRLTTFNNAIELYLFLIE